ncbi:Glyco_tranf_GTA_type domain containing protein [uncultured Caudovirales phage]|uniref:Glyco_tranf_GTA_type domain containing protein n=1 Tax=uncultured Caudovirales phage TaxID=2100421 RepID=A0A6J5NKW1_9CAUD|nr:Glyco_tranf_GTA_type domain containing protein [uncultured Caudovirales phage]
MNKNIPIVILNRDRFHPLREQVECLQKYGYNNIIVIDNYSTYQPLLDWYKTANINVFHNTLTENSCHAFRDLILNVRHPLFVSIIQDWYVFNDSDIIPADGVPEDFIEHLIAYAIKYNKSKVGMSIEINDIDLNYPLNAWVHSYESGYWTNGIVDGDVELYPHPIDTTFAVHAPHIIPTWSNDTLRVGYPYVVKHAPFYYDPNNLPDDEKYYLEHMNKQSSNWSSKVEIK